jgi:hypothetical protein
MSKVKRSSVNKCYPLRPISRSGGCLRFFQAFAIEVKTHNEVEPFLYGVQESRWDLRQHLRRTAESFVGD